MSFHIAISVLWYAKPLHKVTVTWTCKMECCFIKSQIEGTTTTKETLKFYLGIWPASSITIIFSWLLGWSPWFPWQQSSPPHSQSPNWLQAMFSMSFSPLLHFESLCFTLMYYKKKKNVSFYIQLCIFAFFPVSAHLVLAMLILRVI